MNSLSYRCLSEGVIFKYNGFFSPIATENPLITNETRPEKSKFVNLAWLKTIIHSYQPKWRPRMTWPVILAFAIPFVAILLMWGDLKWQVATQWEASRVLVWLVVGLFALLGIVYFVYFAHREAAQMSPSVSGRRTLLTVCLFCGLIGWDLATSITASRLDAFVNTAFPQVDELYTNHDQANLVGKIIRIMLLKTRKEEENPAARDTLKGLADHAPKAWQALIKSPNPADRMLVRGVTGQKLALALVDPSHEAIDPQRWQVIIERWTIATQQQPLPANVSRRVAESMSRLFALSLREAVKHAWIAGDKAWPAFQIDIATTLVDRVKVQIDSRDEVLQQELATLSGGMRGINHLAQKLTREQRSRHVEIVSWFENLSKQLNEIQHVGTLPRR